MDCTSVFELLVLFAAASAAICACSVFIAVIWLWMAAERLLLSVADNRTIAFTRALSAFSAFMRRVISCVGAGRDVCDPRGERRADGVRPP